MLSRPSRDDCERFLRWLSHGSAMAVDTYGGRANACHVVWCLLENAVEIVDKLPDQEKRWLTSGTRSGGWNQVGMSAWEALLVERARMMSAMLPAEGHMGFKPGYDDEQRALDVMSWLQWCRSMRGFHELQKAAVLLARGAHLRDVAAVYRPGREPSRTLTYEIRQRVFVAITRGLRTDCNIVPDGLAPRFDVLTGWSDLPP